MNTKIITKAISSALSLAVFLTAAEPFVTNAEQRTYTVTANLYCPGELNTQLPGVTAYLTNGNNPLGLEGYEAVAPTTPVENNAQLEVNSDGSVILDLEVKNPVFTLQSIGNSSNAEILSAPKDDKTYSAGGNSVKGRIKELKIRLNDHSGKYVFNSCTEYPTLLGNEWNVPLTLEVDLNGVDFDFPQEDNAVDTEENDNGGDNNNNEQPLQINYDSLNAAVSTAEKLLNDTVISADGKDIDKKEQWVTQESYDKLKSVLDEARAALSSQEQGYVDEMAAKLSDACGDLNKSKKSGTKPDSDEKLGKKLKAGKYTVSANIWFNKAETGLPLNPHITNPSFPPMDSVEGNAQLVIAEDGSADVTIPIVIQDKVMTVHSIEGLELSDVKQGDNGAISEITVHFDKLEGDSTVMTKDCKCEIQMGDLAMTISGLERDHNWNGVFELNLSGVATEDGCVMPTVEIEKNDLAQANNALALAGVTSQSESSSLTESRHEESKKAKSPASSANDKDDPSAGTVAAGAAVIVIAAGAGIFAVRKRRSRS